MKGIMSDEYFSEKLTPSQLQQAAAGRFANDVYTEETVASPNVLAIEPNPDSLDPKAVSSPLRVAYVGPSFNIGGVEQHLQSLAKFLNPAAISLEKCVVTDPARLDTQFADSLPVDVEVCLKQDLRQCVAYMDLVLMWGDSYNNCLDPDGPTNVFIAHGDSWWTRRGLEGSSSVVHHVIAVSTRVQRRQCAGFPSTVILNGVDTSRLSCCRAPGELRQELGFDHDDFIIGSVGRMTREKQMHLLIEAVRLLPTNFKLLLVGGGPREAEWLSLANTRIPGRYAMLRVKKFLGDYYREMDAFALVSEHEGFGLVIAEAMHCGRPVIATEVGCVPEVIEHRINGIVVDPTAGDIRDAAMLIHQHPQWASGIAAEGKALAERNFQARQMADRYERVLTQIHRSRSSVTRTGAA
jgi:glycosyltransferase involved in cell wall biosynthesis